MSINTNKESISKEVTHDLERSPSSIHIRITSKNRFLLFSNTVNNKIDNHLGRSSSQNYRPCISCLLVITLIATLEKMADENQDLDERAIEFSAILAIYPELQVDLYDPFSASIDIPVEPLKPLAVIFPPLVNQSLRSRLPTPPNSDKTSDVQPTVPKLQERPVILESEDEDIHYLANLPPLTLKIHLQDGYPTQKPPIFNVLLKLPWLPETKLQELAAVGLSIWEDMGRDQVVFAYIDYLRDAAEQGFNLLQNGQVYLELPQSLQITLLDFDLQTKRTKFEQETFECGVCLGTKFPMNILATKI